jgi:4-hydroxybenzoate polyprenyltransferase
LKNLLVFIPLLAAHKYDQLPSLFEAVKAFFIFCLTASSVYVINDLIDTKEDCLHPRKKDRPFASGALPRSTGHKMWMILLVVSGLLSFFFLNQNFTLTLVLYFLFTLAYTFKIKKIPVLDVLALSMFYTFRIIGGAAAVDVIPSFWLLTFSMFFFFSLATMKRFIEINSFKASGKSGQITGKGYTCDDAGLLLNFGTAAGFLSIMVLALYIQDPHTVSMYLAPHFIWLACPVLLFWILRIWFLANRGRVHEDPIVFALKDKVSLFLAIMVVGIFSLAKLWGK